MPEVETLFFLLTLHPNTSGQIKEENDGLISRLCNPKLRITGT